MVLYPIHKTVCLTFKNDALSYLCYLFGNVLGVITLQARREFNLPNLLMTNEMTLRKNRAKCALKPTNISCMNYNSYTQAFMTHFHTKQMKFKINIFYY